MSASQFEQPAAADRAVSTASDSVRVEPRSVTAEIANALRMRIKYGRLAPGQRLVEADLIQQLSVSRSTVRAALTQLASEGIVTLEHNRGAHVRVLDLEGIRQLYEVRATLEGRAAGLTARRIDDPGCRGAVEELLARGREFSDWGSFSAYWTYNEGLHRRLLEFSGNPMLLQLAEQARTLTYHYHLQAATSNKDPSQPLVSINAATHQHGTVLTAILQGDADGAERAMREHIEANGEGIMAYMRTAP